MTKLLIVDDEKLTREILVNHIPWRELGISEVREAANGSEGLEIALRMEPDVVLSDIRMPKMDGIELAKRLKEKIPHCKVVFLSIYTDKDYLKSAIQLNAVDYVEKPVNLEEVGAAVARAAAIASDLKLRRESNPSVHKPGETATPSEQSPALDLIDGRREDAFHKGLAGAYPRIPADGSYVTAVIQPGYTPDNTAAEKGPYLRQAMQVLTEILTAAQVNYLAGIKSNESIIVHFYDSGIPDEMLIRSLLEEFSRRSGELLHPLNRLSIGIGSVVRGAENVRESYRTALIAVQRQFFHSRGNIVPYKEQKDAAYEFDENALNAILACIKERNRDRAVIAIKRLSNEIRRHDNTDVNYIKDCYYRILFQLYKYIEEMNIRISTNDNRRFLWDVISTTHRLDEIEDYLIRLVASIFGFWESEAAKTNISSRITRYIQENLCDPNMSIKAIAEHLFLTPTYLCLIFKKETGKTINQYITGLRMEKARQYLKDTRSKPGEISVKVGYHDVKYFARSFKKEVGMTPLEYRKKEKL